MIEFNTSQTKEELIALALTVDVSVDMSMKKGEIITAMQNYNLSLEEEEEEYLSESDAEEAPKPGEKDLSEPDTKEKATAEEKDLSESDIKKPPQEKEIRGTYVYVGPSLPFGKLVSKSSFIGTKSEVFAHLSAVIKEYPQIKKLIVPTRQVAQMSKRVKNRGNTNYNDFVAIQSAVTQKRKK